MTLRIPPSRQSLAAAKQKLKQDFKPLLPLYRKLRRSAYFLSWVIPALGRVGSRTPSTGRRVLMVYDTSSQPFSLGDILVAQEASLILCQRHGIAKVDFALLFDPSSPAAADPVFKIINEENVFYHLASLLPVAQVNQYLGSVLLYNSAQQLHRLIADNPDMYEVWPPAWVQGTRQYLNRYIFNTLLREHYQRHGALPRLTCRPFLQKWATDFFAAHAAGRVPVTVNIRNNKYFHHHRNSDIAAWCAFFTECQQRYPVAFVLICALSEIEEQLRSVPNIVIAKDHGTSIEQDMALIQGSAIHMGAGSGPATMAWFNDKPYLMVNTDLRNDPFYEHEGMVEVMQDGVQRFWFALPGQTIVGGRETPEMLATAFATMWPHIEPEKWKVPPGDGTTAGVSSWLR
jgi:hypothetical protein